MPRSLVIVLWWGRNLVLVTPDGRSLTHELPPGAGDDPVTVLTDFVAAESPWTQAVRLVYHPRRLECHLVSCPQTTGPRLRKILAGDHPALTRPDTAATHETVRSAADGGFQTILYLEPESALPRLRSKWEALGVELEMAVPLPALVEAKHRATIEEAGVLALLSLGENTLAYCYRPGVGRFLRSQTGSLERRASGDYAAAAFFDGAEAPPALVVSDAEHEAPPESAVAPPTRLNWSGFLAGVRELPPGGTNLVASRAWFRRPETWARGTAVVGLALLGGTVWHGFDAKQRFERAAAEQGSAQAEAAELSTWVDTHQQVRVEHEDIVRLLAEASTASSRKADLLFVLSRSVPPTIRLTRLEISDRRFTIRGETLGSAAAAEANRLRGLLSQPDLPWRMADAAPTNAAVEDAHFVFQGQFHESAIRPEVPHA